MTYAHVPGAASSHELVHAGFGAPTSSRAPIVDAEALGAEALARAVEVREVHGDDTCCLGCGAHTILERVVVLKPSTTGTSERPNAHAMAGLCPSCVEWCSVSRHQAVAELASAAGLVDSLLALVRRRAAALLARWWGDVGNCTQEQIDEASVRVRRAVERLGAR